MANTQYPADFIAQFNDVVRRVEALERTPPTVPTDIRIPAMTMLANWSSVGGTTRPYSALPLSSLVWPDLESVGFTLTKASTVLLLINLSFYGYQGTANYVEVRPAIRQAGATAAYGNAAVAPVTLAGMDDPWHVAPASSFLYVQLAAGNYTACIQYNMEMGAVTQIIDLNPGILVFLMGT